ncbi:putative signal transducing protein [Chitinophaga nivalis]|uniref:DUF2007 domain-containing protein n=1 Tax=Chitinophaga nivalis TaxID=2991709 RepID=A0ABT3IV05_9BACT|nr:DUF2007 domain-containing protein [Chitinophaga nivalis]MCW3462490.1 DUF2007 domain-containing protein [Chitinophaga nivalis]MCW3487819.1 DUF2007 domain-containing protein [Chitinophaga nivalis]
MEKDWIKIFSSDRPFEAEIVKGMLLDNGIEAVLLNRQSSSYNITLPGQIELYVHKTQQDTAESLVKNHNNLPTGDPSGTDTE